MSKFFIVAFGGAIPPGINLEDGALQEEHILSLLGTPLMIPAGTLYHETNIHNVFFIEDTEDKLTEESLSKFYEGFFQAKYNILTDRFNWNNCFYVKEVSSITPVNIFKK